LASHKVLLEGQEFDYECEEGDTLLRSALRAGLGFPYECNSGGCGSCKFELIEGEIDNLWEDAPGRSARDIRKGRMLGCQCVPKNDCTIKVRLEHHSAPEHKPSRLEAELVQINTLTNDMYEFCFRTKHAAGFLPGQFALLDFPGVTGSRGYSMSNLPNDEGLWNFIIKKMPDGRATSYLFDECETGIKINLDGPYGLAFLKPEIPRDIVLIGGGSGLSPIMSIARAAANDPRLNDRKIYMFYGGRGPDDICTPALVSNEETLDKRLICFNAISDPKMNKDGVWGGDCCFIHELVAKQLGDSLPEHEFYFCGPPPMTDATTRMLMMEYKVPFEQIHYDRFY